MEHLLDLLCLCLLCLTGKTLCDKNGPENIEAVEDGDVMLPCSLSTKENIEFKLFDWRKVAQKNDGLKEVFMYDGGSHYNNGLGGQSEEFKGRVSHFPDELKHGNASIIIRNTKISDSGDYTCDFPRLQPPQKFYIKLVVGSILKDRTDENIPGAAPTPSITTRKTEDGVLLQCKVHGTPKPKVEWQDIAGTILTAEELQVSEREGRFYITLTAAVTRADDYRCVAIQETIKHQISTRIYVNEQKLVKVTEGSNVVLPCYLITKEDITSKLFDWKKVAQKDDCPKDLFYYNGGINHKNCFPGQVSYFPDELKHGNASIIIRNTKISDSGNYTCYFPNLQPPQIFYIELVVVGYPNGWIAVAVTLFHLLLLVGGVLFGLVYKGYFTLNPNKVIKVEEGSDVTLPCYLWPKDIRSKVFFWLKVPQKTAGDQKVFLYDKGDLYSDERPDQSQQFKGRVSHFPDKLKQGNASIIIRNTRRADSGEYRCIYLDLQEHQEFYIKLDVGQEVIKVEEGSNVTLPCSLSTKEDIRSSWFFWQKTNVVHKVFLYDKGHLYSDERPGQSKQFKGRVSHFPDELEQGNASIIIRNTTRADSGEYRCFIQSIQKHHLFYIKLVVGSTRKKEHCSLMI